MFFILVTFSIWLHCRYKTTNSRSKVGCGILSTFHIGVSAKRKLRRTFDNSIDEAKKPIDLTLVQRGIVGELGELIVHTRRIRLPGLATQSSSVDTGATAIEFFKMMDSRGEVGMRVMNRQEIVNLQGRDAIHSWRCKGWELQALSSRRRLGR